MTNTRNMNPSRSERASAIIKMVELLNQMRTAVLDQSKWGNQRFINLLNEYEQLASPLSTNKLDKMFIEQFHHKFIKLCSFASENVSAQAVARKNAIDWNLAERKFDLSESEPDQQSADVLASFLLAHPELNFIEKSKVYQHEGREIRFAQNLIRSKSTIAGAQKFYIISNKEEDSFGKGTDSRIRKVTASIEINNGSVEWQVEGELGVRITNTQSAQARHIQKQSEYSHETAIESFKKAEPFKHYGLQHPIEVKKQSKMIKDAEENRVPSGDYTKSYSLVNLLPGKDFDKTCNNYMASPRTTKEVIDFIILPLLETYVNQVPDDLSHSDIKPANVLIKIGDESEPSEVNFLDFDYVQKIGEVVNTKGTPGYIPPEVFEPNTLVDPSRDTFALGVLITASINKDLEPQALLTNVYDCNNENVVSEFNNLLNINSVEPSYDAKAVLEASNDLFQDKIDALDSEISDYADEVAFFQIYVDERVAKLATTKLNHHERMTLEKEMRDGQEQLESHELAITNLKKIKASCIEKYNPEELAANLFKYVHDKEPIPEHQREELRNLLKDMTSWDKNLRPDISEAIKRVRKISQELTPPAPEHNDKKTSKKTLLARHKRLFHHDNDPAASTPEKRLPLQVHTLATKK